jgi:HSP20 family protein
MLNSISDFIEAKFDRINNFFEEKCTNVNNFFDRVQQEIVPSSVVSLTNKFRYDFVEMNDRYVIELEMPGISKENVEIFLEDNEDDNDDSNENVYIIVVGEKIASQSNVDYYLRKERKYGKQSRSILLPQDCDLCRIKATFCNNGILNITIAKKQANSSSSDEEPLQMTNLVESRNETQSEEPIEQQRHIKTITIDDE